MSIPTAQMLTTRQHPPARTLRSQPATKFREEPENGSAGIESAQSRFAAAARSARQAVRHVMNWHGTFGGYFTGRHFGQMVLAHRQCAG
ncbi:MAG: hypothetical protein IJ783_00965 [Kiritimatiellae bacterium]|nr:hypothetical protein [Kiritimatiellia bacterium]